MVLADTTYRRDTMDSLLEVRTGDALSSQGKKIYPGTQPSGKVYRSVPSAEGAIQSLVVSCNVSTAPIPTIEEQKAIAGQLKGLCEAFAGRDVMIHVLLPGAPLKPESRFNAAQVRARMYRHPLGPVLNFIGGGDASRPDNLNPQFVQDYIHPCEMKGMWHNGRNAVKLLRPVKPPRRNMAGRTMGLNRLGSHLRVNERLAAAMPSFSPHYTPLYMEGGNVHMLRQGRHDILLCGTNNIKLNRQAGSLVDEHSPEDAWIKEELCRLYMAEEAMWIENYYPPVKSYPSLLFHIDLFVTPAGCLPAGRQLIFVGSISREHTLVKQRHIERTEWPAWLDDHRKYLDRIAASFPAGRYQVVRIPLPVVLDVNDVHGSYLLSYNNALAETTEKGRRLLMPSYTGEGSCSPHIMERLEVMERKTLPAILAPWFAGGISFVKGNYHQMARNNKGALHCSVKVLERR